MDFESGTHVRVHCSAQREKSIDAHGIADYTERQSNECEETTETHDANGESQSVRNASGRS